RQRSQERPPKASAAAIVMPQRPVTLPLLRTILRRAGCGITKSSADAHRQRSQERPPKASAAAIVMPQRPVTLPLLRTILRRAGCGITIDYTAHDSVLLAGIAAVSGPTKTLASADAAHYGLAPRCGAGRTVAGARPDAHSALTIRARQCP